MKSKSTIKHPAAESILQPRIADDFEGCYSRAVCAFIQYQYRDALNEVDRALELEPQHKHALKLRTHLRGLTGFKPELDNPQLTLPGIPDEKGIKSLRR